MTIRLESNCLQIESAVRDVPAACAAFEEILGAGPIEQELVRRISGVVLDIDHRGCGDAMFQFCSPLVDTIFTAEELRRVGPSVTNLTFFVADAAGTRDLLAAEGAATRMAWQTMPGSWQQLLGPGNAKPDEDLAPGFFMGTRHLFGFDFEFSEAPWYDVAAQSYMHPAFTYPRPAIADKVRRLERLRVLVDDIGHYTGNLLRLVDAGDRTGVYAHREDEAVRSARIALRGLELEYVQPLAAGPLRDRLAERGPAVTTAVFSADPAAGLPPAAFATTGILGFDIEVEHEPAVTHPGE
ncbi:hypothetical protein [Yinghuangia soli]|uniref:Glyoxalase-like domain-containing protein n=1 Tax=Yinghuangia soli TaxID=2908204 RepID=A0AA41Q998_9ACTN|nr:hypothetical protein [Yinghuangia soli]MCF2532542.1 hypothetical protein [Yinghuangia soli]